MTKVVKVGIEFEFDEDSANEGLDEPMSESDLIDYAIRTYVEDISTMYLHNELHSAVRVVVVGG